MTAQARRPPTVSVVIPARDEADRLPATLAAVARAFPGAEVVVADGGSTDGTREAAAAAGARVVTGAVGRGPQLRAGVAAAGGELLVLLHADCRPAPGAEAAVRRVLADPRFCAGCFVQHIAEPADAGPWLRFSLRFIRLGNDGRARLLQSPYGDQGLFLTRAAWDRAGGAPAVPLFEDVDLVARVRRAHRGRRVAVTPPALTVSPRRWLSVGPWRTTLANHGFLVARRAGMPHDRLARLYYGGGRAPVLRAWAAAVGALLQGRRPGRRPARVGGRRR